MLIPFCVERGIGPLRVNLPGPEPTPPFSPGILVFYSRYVTCVNRR